MKTNMKLANIAVVLALLGASAVSAEPASDKATEKATETVQTQAADEVKTIQLTSAQQQQTGVESQRYAVTQQNQQQQQQQQGQEKAIHVSPQADAESKPVSTAPESAAIVKAVSAQKTQADAELVTDITADAAPLDVAHLSHLLREFSPEALDSDAGREIAKQLVERIDGLRGYENQGFSFEMTNISYRRVRRGGEMKTESRENSLNVSVLGEQSLVKFLTPARDKGRLILKTGRNMWLYIPGTSKTLRVTPAQRLIGEASNGDVTGTNFGAEYTAELSNLSLEKDTPTVEVTLSANSRSVTYSRIVFQINLTDLLPIQSEYYSISGKLLKRADYVEFKQFDQQLKIHKMRLSDPVTADRVTWLKFDKYQLEAINPAIFNADSLSRL